MIHHSVHTYLMFSCMIPKLVFSSGWDNSDHDEIVLALTLQYLLKDWPALPSPLLDPDTHNRQQLYQQQDSSNTILDKGVCYYNKNRSVIWSKTPAISEIR